MAQVQIDEEKRRLIIRAQGRDEGYVLVQLPSRRWMPKQGTFIVPITRNNMQLLVESALAGKIDLGTSFEFIKKASEHKLGNRPFPSWYKFKTKPYPDQEKALIKTYKNDEAALFMRMGSGKSKVIIDRNNALFLERRIDAAMLICPLTVCAVWEGEGGELEVHSPGPYKIIRVDSTFDLGRVQFDPAILTWFLVGIESLSQGRTFERLVPLTEKYKISINVDESSRIKNFKAIRTERAISLGTKAVARLISTGTPSTKSLMDLYAQFQFLNPNIIGVGDYYAFRNRYAVMGGYKQKEVVGYSNVDELMGLIEPYTYRCDKPKGLPSQIWMPPRMVHLTEHQLELYRKIKKAELEGVTVKNVLSKMLRLQQIVGGFYTDDPKKEPNPLTGRIKIIPGVEHRIVEADQNPKIKEIITLLDEIEPPMIIWARFTFEINDIVSVLQKYGKTAKFTGEVDQTERLTIRQEFQKGNYDFLVGNQQVGGIGHTFTRAHFMIYFSNTDSLEDRLQSEDRIHRRGQEDDCVYIDLVADKTVDKTRLASIHDKKDLDQYVRDKLDQAGERAMDQLLGDA